MHKAIWELLFPLAMPFFWTSAEGNGGDGDEPDPEPGPEPEPEPDDDEDLDKLKKELAKKTKALAKANTEAKERRLKLKELEEAEEERKKAAMGDLEKAQAELKEAVGERDKLRQERIDNALRHAVELAALKMSFNDPMDASRLADLSEVKIDPETLEVTGIEDALKALLKAKPYLVKSEDTDPDGTPRGADQRKGKGKRPLPEKSMAPL